MARPARTIDQFTQMSLGATARGDKLLIWDDSEADAGATKVVTTEQLRGDLLRMGREFDITDPYFGGAVADGTTDNTTAIQTALDACEDAGGGIVRIPPGDSHYVFSGALTLGTNPVMLLGASGYRYDETSWLRYTGTGTAMTVESNNARFIGMRLSSLTGAVGIDTNACLGLDFDHCEIVGFSTTQIEGTDSWWVNVRRCTIQGAAANGSRGISSASNWNAWQVESNSFICTHTYNWNAIAVNTAGGAFSSTGSVIRNNDFAHGATGLYAIDFYAGSFGMHVTGNRVENEGLGFIRHRDNAFGLVAHGNQIAGADSGLIPVGMLLEGGDYDIGMNSWVNTTTVFDVASSASDRGTIRIARQSFPLAPRPTVYTAGLKVGGEDGTGEGDYAVRVNGALEEVVSEDRFTNLSTSAVAAFNNKVMLAGDAVCRLTTIGGHSGTFRLSIGEESGVGFKFTAVAGGNCTVSEGAEGVFSVTVTGDARTYTLTCNTTSSAVVIAASSTATGTTTLAIQHTRFR